MSARTAGRVAAMPRSGRVAAVIVALALLAAACVGGPSPQPDSTPGTLPSKGAASQPSGSTQTYATDASLTLGLRGEPADWNPLAAPTGGGAVLAAVAAAVLPSAFVVAADGTEVRNDDLVTSATSRPASSSGPQTVTYEINPRATWSDGVAVTASDFVLTWQAQSGRATFRDRGGRPYTPASTAGYRQVASVSAGADDPDEVVVRFASPDPDWEALFDPILPAHVVRAVGFDHGFTDPVTSLLSAGPFVVQSYRPGRDVELVRNPAWWGTTADLAAIDITFVGSVGEATTGLEEGQLDAAVGPFTTASVASLRATSGLTVTVGAGATYDDLVLDERSGPLSERAVRLALITAVDRSALVATARRAGDTGAAAVDNRVVAPGSVGYRDDAGILGGGGTAARLARARGLLSAAGFTVSGGVLSRGGTPVQLDLAVGSTSPLAGDEATAVAAAARALGITVTVSGSPAAPAPAVAVRAAEMAIVAEPLASATSVSGALAATYGTGGAADVTGYSSTVMDGLLARLATVTTTTEAGEVADQVDALAWSDAVDLPLLGVPQVLAYQSRYTGLAATPTQPALDDDPAGWGIPAST